MELTEKEQKMLDGEMGEGKQKAMEILSALAKIYGAERMVPVSSVQVAGVSYKTIGDAGLEFLQGFAKLKGASAEVPAFLNPMGMDRFGWKKQRVPQEFAGKQIDIMHAYTSMGISSTCTCAPYLIGIRPKAGEHIAWAESSAVIFANSVLGARTNREGGPSALCAAIAGVTPEYGLHLEENRVADLVVKVEAKLSSRFDYGALGGVVAVKAKGKKIPAFRALAGGEDELKYLGAALASWGGSPMFMAQGITPEWSVGPDAEELVVTKEDLEQFRGKVDEANGQSDIVTLGCPHASMDEIREIARIVKGKKLKRALWVCCSREIKKKAKVEGLAEIIEKAGGQLVADTCMVVSPLEKMGYRSTGADSAKAARYLPSMCRQKVAYGKLEDLIWK